MPMTVTKLLSHLLLPFLLVWIVTMLILGFKGKANSFDLTVPHLETGVGNVFETSNTNSRYALTSSLVESKSFFFTEEQARFAAPDLVRLNGKFFTIFTPGISVAAVPFYTLGKNLGGYQHITTFFTTATFALMNVVLIYIVSRKIGASKILACVAGALFVLATNAYSYAFTLTQHHGTVTILLLLLLNALSKQRTVLNNLVFGILCGIGFLFDFPNIFLFIPIGLYVLSKHFNNDTIRSNVRVEIDLSFVAIAVGFLPLVGAFLWYNLQVTGSPTKFGQMYPRSDYFDSEEVKEKNRLEAAEPKDPFAEKVPFSTRAQLKGFYTLLISDERSWWYYSPVVLIGFLGLVALNRKQQTQEFAILFGSVLFLNIIMYGMFGDPWGGWSFGPRYLIPGAAILSILVSIALTHFRRSIFLSILFLALTAMSSGISIAGALTTNSIPPKIEAQSLTVRIPHTHLYNFELLEAGKSSSLVYNKWLEGRIPLKTYWMILTATTVGIFALALIAHMIQSRKKI